MHHGLFAFLHLLWQLFFLGDLYKDISTETALEDKRKYLPLEQRADLFAVHDNKDNVSLQVKSWEGLLEEIFIRLEVA